MRCFLMLLLFLPVLFGCETNTTADKAGSAIPSAEKAEPVDFATGMFNLGTYVGYSEICAQFRGSGAGNGIIKDIVDRFGEDKDFERGYGQYKSYSAYDRIERLYQCDEVRDGLIQFHKELIEAGGTKT